MKITHINFTKEIIECAKHSKLNNNIIINTVEDGYKQTEITRYLKLSNYCSYYVGCNEYIKYC